MSAYGTLRVTDKKCATCNYYNRHDEVSSGAAVGKEGW